MAPDRFNAERAAAVSNAEDLRVPSAKVARGRDGKGTGLHTDGTIFDPRKEQEALRNEAFFREISGGEQYPGTSLLVVTHVLPHQTISFLDGILTTFPVAGVVPKPDSSDPKELATLERDERYRALHWKRADAGNTDIVV